MLSVKNLTKIYKTKGGEDTRALDNVTLDFPETGLVFLLGKSGSGKSTLLNLIGGLDYPTSGEITLKGRTSKNFKQSDFDSYRNTYVGFVFQEYNILNEFNVEQNIALAIELQNKKVKKEDVDNLLAQVDLKDFAKRKPNTLSGGQKQRIAIARALIKSPKIILADEPTGALDSKTGEQVFDTLKKLSKDKLIIVVSHDRDFAETYGDRIIELKDGKILSDETKFYKEPTQITSNISIVNDEAITINDAQALTKTEFEKLYEQIKGKSGKVYISSGTNAQKSLRATRISDEGSSEEFQKTTEIELKQYDGKDTKFIKSKMPMGKSVKMGLSSLKSKPIRLIFTIFLAVVSFAMFGIVSSLMLYNPAYTYSEAMTNSDYVAESIEKTIIGVTKYSNYENGVLSYESTSDTKIQTQITPEELEEFNNNSLGLKFVGTVKPKYSSGFITNPINITTSRDYYQNFNIYSITDCGEQKLTDLGFTLTGTYPTTKSQIALPMCFFDLLKDNDATVTNIEDAIGKKVSFSINSYNREMTITGFVQVDSIPTTYDQLKDANANISTQEKSKLADGLKNYIQNSFCSVAFGSVELVDELSDGLGTQQSINLYQRKGLEINSWPVTNDVSIDTYTGVYTDKIYEKNKHLISLYDLNDNKLSSPVFADNQMYISYSQYLNLLRDKVNDMNNFYNDMKTDQSMMPNAYAYMAAHNEEIENLIQRINNDFGKDIYTQLKSMLMTFKDEYNVAKKIRNLSNAFTSTSYYANLDEETQQLIQKASWWDSVLTQDEINQVYNILLNNFDTYCPNYFLLNYIKDVYWQVQSAGESISPTIVYMVDNSGNGYMDLSQEQKQEAMSFINNYYEKYYRKSTRGYTFTDYNYFADDEFDIQTVYYYKNYSNQTGTLQIVGYLKTRTGDEWNSLVTKSFVDNLTLAPEHTYENEFITDYVMPDNIRYSNIIAKTNYTLAEIDFMSKTGTGYKYSLTNDIYQQVSYIAELIGNLKTIFFWVGIVMGAFAALMLLNFITVSISTKKREIGILRAIGARKIDVFKIFFSESLFIGLLCFVLASISSFVVEMVLNNSFMADIGIKVLSFGLINIGLILGIAIVVTFIATIIPVWNSSRKPPVESIRAL